MWSLMVIRRHCNTAIPTWGLCDLQFHLANCSWYLRRALKHFVSIHTLDHPCPWVQQLHDQKLSSQRQKYSRKILAAIILFGTLFLSWRRMAGWENDVRMQEDLIFSLNYKLQFTGRLWEKQRIIPGAALYLHLHNCVEDPSEVSVSQLVMGQHSPVLHHLPPAAAVSDGRSSHQSLVAVHSEAI